MPKVIDCVYEDGVFKPLQKVHLKEGARAKLLLEDEKSKILDKYAGIVKLGRTVKIEEILELEEEAWRY
ncbi:MAG: antitoxin family protein [Euryarchaeota archaeon]|nr:antitoxin family protein [Euryarchaeota archaeon]